MIPRVNAIPSMRAKAGGRRQQSFDEWEAYKIAALLDGAGVLPADVDNLLKNKYADINADYVKSILLPAYAKTGKIYVPKGPDYDVVRGTDGSYVGQDGLIRFAAPNEPRFDWTNGCPVLLDEGEALQQLIETSDLSNSAWIKSNLNTYTYNADSSPDGTNTSDLVIVNSGTPIGNNATFQSYNVLAGNTYTASWFVKSGGYDWFFLQVVNGTYNAIQFFNSGTKSVGGVERSLFIDKGVEHGYANGYDRYWVKFVAVTTGSATFAHYSALSNAPFSGVASGGLGHYLWGANLTQGDLSSYIPTTNAAATRNADVITVTPPAGTSRIVTTFENGTSQVLTSIPPTFTIPNGRISKVTMR